MSILFQTKVLRTQRWFFLNLRRTSKFFFNFHIPSTNNNLLVFIGELTLFFEEKAFLQKFIYCRRYQCLFNASNDASTNGYIFLDDFGLRQQVTVPAHKSGGILDKVITCN